MAYQGNGEMIRATVLAFIGTAILSSDGIADPLRCGGSHAVNRITINRGDAKCEWPFRVNRVQLVCHGLAQVAILTVHSDDVEYSLNGTARSLQRRFGFRELDELLHNPRAGLSEWIEAARQACIAR